MSIGVEADLQAWLRSKLQRAGDGALRMLEVRHMINGREADALDSWVDHDFREMQVPDLAHAIYMAAKTDASRLKGRQFYAVRPYFGSARIAEGRFPLEFFDRDKMVREEDAGGPSDAPNEVGALGIMMRHAADAMAHAREMGALLVQATSDGRSTLISVLEVLKALLIEERARNTALENSRMPMIEAFERTLTQEHERKLATELSISEIKNKRDVIDTIKILAPAIVNAFAGRKILPEQMTADMVLMREVVAQMSDEHMKLLMQSVAMQNPAMAGALLDTFERWRKEEATKAAAAAAEAAQKGVGSIGISSIQPKRSLAEATKSK